MPKATRIKLERQRAGFQQKEVAKKLGISVQYYNEIENGLRPSFRLALRLGEFFRLTIDDLFRAGEFVSSPNSGERDTQ